MRRYQLSGLEHVHMMRHVPRSYDMTRTHILHKSVNKHVDVVLRCSPKNWKKKKVTVSVVKGEKKNDAARIRANAKKGYVAVRKVVNDQFEADRKAAAAAFETKYGARSASSDALIHDMKSQLSTMAKKSADYIENQLTNKQVYPAGNYTGKSADPEAEARSETKKPLISEETEEILKKGGYRLPGAKPEGSPYAADYLMHASNEEFHSLMDSLEKSLDEACKKYAAQPEEQETSAQTETESGKTADNTTEATDYGYEGYTGYSGGYNMPGNVSLSVTKKQEIKAEEKDDSEEFRPALTFTEGGEHYIPEDGLFDRELNRPGERYVPPAYLFDEEETGSQSGADNGGEGYVPLPEAIPVMPSAPEPQKIFYTEENEPVERQEDYPGEDYVQQQIFFTTQPEEGASPNPYDPRQEEEEFAEPTMYHDMSGLQDNAPEESDYEPPMVFPDEDFISASPAADAGEDDGNDGYGREGVEEQPSADFAGGDEDESLPMIFPDDEEDESLPTIFPDDDEGYSPTPVSPDINEFYDDFKADNGVVNRSGQTLFSRTGDQIKKVIGIIRGSGGVNVNSDYSRSHMSNHNVEITYTDQNIKHI